MKCLSCENEIRTKVKLSGKQVAVCNDCLLDSGSSRPRKVKRSENTERNTRDMLRERGTQC